MAIKSYYKDPIREFIYLVQLDAIIYMQVPCKKGAELAPHREFQQIDNPKISKNYLPAGLR